MHESSLITALGISSIRHRETAIFARKHAREGTSRLFICKSSECRARDDKEREPESLKAMETMFSVSPICRFRYLKMTYFHRIISECDSINNKYMSIVSYLQKQRTTMHRLLSVQNSALSIVLIVHLSRTSFDISTAASKKFPIAEASKCILQTHEYPVIPIDYLPRRGSRRGKTHCGFP